MVTIRNGQGEALPRHRGFKSAIRNVTRFSFQSADRCEVKDFLREECVSIDVRLLKCTRICRNPRDNGSRIWPSLLLCMAYYDTWSPFHRVDVKGRWRTRETARGFLSRTENSKRVEGQLHIAQHFAPVSPFQSPIYPTALKSESPICLFRPV